MAKPDASNRLLTRLTHALAQVEQLPASEVRKAVLAAGNDLTTEVQRMLRLLKNSQERMARYERILDSRYDEIELGVLSTIDNTGAALTAVELYDTSFFANLPLSEQAQIRLVRALIEKCASYKVSSSAWNLISRNNTVVLDKEINDEE